MVLRLDLNVQKSTQISEDIRRHYALHADGKNSAKLGQKLRNDLALHSAHHGKVDAHAHLEDEEC